MPSWKNAPWLAAEPDGAAGWSSSVPFGGTAPASGTRRSNNTESPARTTTRTLVVCRRASSAPTVSAAGDAGRAADAAERRPGGPVVPRRGHDQGVEPLRAVDRAGERAVAEGGERLDEGDQRDPRRVVGVAVAVRVDRTLEPGEELVGARVDRVVAALVGLPAGDADRQHGRAGRDPRRRPGESSPAISVPWRSSWAGSVGFARACASAPSPTTSIPVEHAAVEGRLVQRDAGVEQRDRDAAAGDPGQADAGHPRPPAGAAS